ncbi:unnamed protein product [Mytilus edulis]|uniref:Uncharacterized protein n=1 Tax=Mytilus edulis TaxID=6550 RepID=A0A8S3RU85_MYTED|nr:unnamed protein product [Mytilus edulis]
MEKVKPEVNLLKPELDMFSSSDSTGSLCRYRQEPKHTISLNTNYSNKEISPFTQIAVTNQNVYIGGAGGIVSLDLTTSSDNLINNHSDVWLLLHWGDIKDIIYCYNNIDLICFQQENVCNRNYSHTFESTTGIENKNPVYAGKDVITSVDILFHKEDMVTYIGTEDGRIER